VSDSRLKVVPIVEGDGEVVAIPILLRRICEQFAPGSFIDVLKPIRQPRGRLLVNRDDCLDKSISLAKYKLRQCATPDAQDLVLLLADADDDCAAAIGPKTLAMAQTLHSDIDIACIFAVMEYETWFVAAATSLASYLRVDEGSIVPDSPEMQRCRKKWVETHFRGSKYSETVDQPKMTAKMDLRLCRSRAPSFDKLCREIEARL
jgi:hypothetical protein